ncbi:hypothetical protein [Terrimonas pollutisoli]|uniref:hypothetical protein n=1 Tax=Terrimonas pollutisoli TaxID=3034147 RepID=UPI0023ED1C3C|nr:hypothetical protein [Terrimonas sp. H1YJ31]
MKLVRQKSRLILLLSVFCFSVTSFSQGVTGIWRGYFIADNGYQYKLEFQVKQNPSAAVAGVSYSWQDDIRFYGKATMTGSYIGSSQNFRIREIKTVEVRTGGLGGGTCIMNYNLQYSRSGDEEFLEGTYLGKQEVKEGPNPFNWGDCGGGKVFLRKVTTSEFYIEPSLRPKKNQPKSNPPVVKKSIEKPLTPPPVVKKTTPKTTTPRTVITKKPDTPPAKILVDSTKKSTPEINKPTTKPIVITPSVLKTRENKLAQSIIVSDPEVTVKLYDNGEIDDDTISVYLNKKLILSNKRLSAAPIKLSLSMQDDEDQELTMVAENLGRIPPNTSLMIVEAGDKRFEVRITSSEQKNAVVRFKYQKPN